MSRKFNRTQKQFIFISADGKCQNCGNVLDDTWEADHVKPYSKGGPTEINNGQALCRKCNREKGNKMKFQLRDWQKRFIESYWAKNKDNFLLVATPGAGKTKASLYLVKDLLGDIIDKIIIVTPTEALKYQWQWDAKDFGIDLHPQWDRDKPIKSGYDGICVTYQQAAGNSIMLDHICRTNRVFVIFDEVHHAGDSLFWGQGIKQAFFNATRRLSTSGTPFRSDNNSIPFVEYINHKSQADFIYGYGQAVTDKDQVCRHIAFFGLDAYTAWYVGEDPFEILTFDEDLSKEQESRRLRTALSSRVFLEGMLIEGNKELNSERETSPSAGGLVVCMDTNHADEIANIMKKDLGESPIVIHSGIKDVDLTALINSIRDDASVKWIIAVKMVSEGVDIPRLRVVVYATNIIAELYFRQIIGRVVRRQGENDTWASFFMPKDERLMAFAEQVKQEREHAIQETRNREAIEDRLIQQEQERFYPWGAHRNPENDGLVIDETYFSLNFRNKANERLAGYGFSEKERVIILSIFDDPVEDKNSMPKNGTNPESRYEKEDHLRKRITNEVNHLARRIKEETGTKLTLGEIIKHIHGTWKGRGNQEQGMASVEDLERKLLWVVNTTPGDYRRFV